MRVCDTHSKRGNIRVDGCVCVQDLVSSRYQNCFCSIWKPVERIKTGDLAHGGDAVERSDTVS